MTEQIRKLTDDWLHLRDCAKLAILHGTWGVLNVDMVSENSMLWTRTDDEVKTTKIIQNVI